MITINSNEKFKILAIKIEHLKQQLKNTFDLHAKQYIKKEIQQYYKQIDNILDNYNNKGTENV